jgi:hypothetical protein
MQELWAEERRTSFASNGWVTCLRACVLPKHCIRELPRLSTWTQSQILPSDVLLVFVTINGWSWVAIKVRCLPSKMTKMMTRSLLFSGFICRNLSSHRALTDTVGIWAADIVAQAAPSSYVGSNIHEVLNMVGWPDYGSPSRRQPKYTLTHLVYR